MRQACRAAEPVTARQGRHQDRRRDRRKIPVTARLRGQAALKAAGVSEADASRVLISMDRDDGMTLYEVRFDAGGTEYDYEIQASDGQVVSSDLEKIRDDGRGGNASTAVSREQAMETALAKVPGAAEKDIRIELDYDDGRYRYEGDIIYDRVEYDFEIDADSGEIVEWSEERN